MQLNALDPLVLAIFQESICIRPLGPIFRFSINEPPRLHTGNAHKRIRSNASHHTHILDIFVNMMQAQISSSSANDLNDCLIFMIRLCLAHFMQYIHDVVDLYRRWKRDQSLGIQIGENHDVERLYQLWCAFREELEDFKASTRASSRFIDRSCGSSKDSRAKNTDAGGLPFRREDTLYGVISGVSTVKLLPELNSRPTAPLQTLREMTRFHRSEHVNLISGPTFYNIDFRLQPTSGRIYTIVHL